MIPVARSRRNNGNSTMQLTVDGEGMGFDADIDVMRNVTAAELYSFIDRGDMNGMSFAFLIADQRWEGLETDYPTRYINKFSVIREISAVTFPAYDATEINARSKDALDSARAELESSRRKADAEVETSDINMARLRAKIKMM
jgi:HK97 family phage prohead protease